jgi:hypothetical protein
VPPTKDVPNSLDALKRTVATCLATAEADRASSIALPLMCCGIYGFKVEDVTPVILEAIMEHLASRAKPSLLCGLVALGLIKGSATESSIKRVVIFDMFKPKADAVAKVVEGRLGPASVARPVSTSMSCSYARPQEPERPLFVWIYCNASGREAAKAGQGNDWVVYDYDQCMELERAFTNNPGGTTTVHVTGDRMGATSDTRHPDPTTGRGEYAVHLSPKGHHQENRVSGFQRMVKRVPVSVAGEVVPMYEQRVEEYKKALKDWEANERRGREARAAGAGAAAGGGPGDTPAVPASGDGVYLRGFREGTAGAKAELQRLLRVGMCESEQRIVLPAFMAAEEIRREVAAELAQLGAELVEHAGGLKVRALGDRARLEGERAVHAAILALSMDVVPRHWRQRQASQAQPLELVTLPGACDEFERVRKRFSRGMSATIVQIQRVENVALWTKYVMHKRAIAAENGGDANVEELIHGTRTFSPEEICRSNAGLSVNYSDGG